MAAFGLVGFKAGVIWGGDARLLASASAPKLRKNFLAEKFRARRMTG
jgi:hypothetical protein